MASQVAHNLRLRRSFSRTKKIIDLPYLIEIQWNSYDLFLQKNASADRRQSVGLQGVFQSVFPIKNFNETACLEFVSYRLGEPKYDVDECRQRGMTYAAPLKEVLQTFLTLLGKGSLPLYYPSLSALRRKQPWFIEYITQNP